jgi:DNA-binding MarR family transcriptional regulator
MYAICSINSKVQPHKRYGLTQAAWRILAVVGDKPGMSARQIRHAAGLDQFATSRAIGQLHELGYAERNAADRDRRRAEVYLTAEGKAVFRELSRVCLAVESELASSLSDAQRSQLNRLLNEMDKACAGIVSRGLRAIVEDASGQPGPA